MPVTTLGQSPAVAVKAAADAGMVVPAFNIPYLPMMQPVCDSLKRHNCYGMVQVARLELYKFESESLAKVAEYYHRYADTSLVFLHLDHIPVIDEDGKEVDWYSLISEALNSGYQSVMIDGSRLPYEDNIRVTAEVVAMSHAKGVPVEAELGSVFGHEDGPMLDYDEIFKSKKGFTDVLQAKEFVERTGVDWLSVSVGTVHGAISPKTKDDEKVRARIDIERLKEIRSATGVPLVLHGGSGVEQEYLTEAIRNGMAKINIATDIRQPYERCLKATGSVSKACECVGAEMSNIIENVCRAEDSVTRLNGYSR